MYDGAGSFIRQSLMLPHIGQAMKTPAGRKIINLCTAVLYAEGFCLIETNKMPIVNQHKILYPVGKARQVNSGNLF